MLFAGTVCLVHAYQLSGYAELAWLADILSSAVAVKAFFVVSGFLIFMSFERSSSVSSYASKRLRRIYPAYVTVVMLCAIGLASVTSSSLADYFSPAWIRYLLANLSFLNFLQPTLPGVFETNNLAAVNGALWTLKIEVMFYLAVPLFVFLFRRFGRLPILAVTYALSVVYAYGFAKAAQQTGSGLYAELGRQLPGQLSYFVAGAFFYYYIEFLEQHRTLFLAAAIAILVANTVWPLPFLEPFALATTVVFFGLFFYAGNFGRYGDFSYGVYILHFPIIQLLLFLYADWFRASPWLFLAMTTSITIVAAIAMWHLVEKRFLLRNSHYIDAALTPPAAQHR